MALDALGSDRRGRLASGRYVICIGAGIGYGLVPDWFELTRRVTERVFKRSWDKSRFDEIGKGSRWSFDSLIQAAENHWILGGGDAAGFHALLGDCLYSDILADFAKYGLGDALADGLHRPNQLNKKQVEAIDEVLTNQYGGTSLMQLAEALLDAEARQRLPAAIVTFNAESLLYFALYVRRKVRFWKRTGTGDNPAGGFSRVFRGVDYSVESVPIIHLHGALMPPVASPKEIWPERTAPQYLVFSEASYLQLAGDMSSWATSTFLFHAQTQRMLFIGLSMSDPNIRRWLGWAHANHQEELANFSAKSIQPRHIWLVEKSADPDLEEIRNVGLLHLGVEPLRVPDYSRVGDAVRNLIAI